MGGTENASKGTLLSFLFPTPTHFPLFLPEESLDHLFEEFYRAPNAKAQVKEGTGLGLAITRDLVMRYGGQISVQSKLGQGTTFVVTLPLAVEPLI